MGKMIEDLEGYFRELVPERDDLLLALEREAREEGIKIVGPLVGALLELLVRVTGARRVLELGAATGYSAIYLARACARLDGRLLTVEGDPAMVERARGNLNRAGVGGVCDVLAGEALEVLGGLTGPFDLIFMDIDKEGYRPALPHCLRLLKPGGLLITDNIGFQRADDFNRALLRDKSWLAVPLLCFLPEHSPEQDGLMMALRR